MATNFAKKYLISEKRKSLFAKLTFFKEHPKINEQILDYAVTITILTRKDFSSDIPNPLEVNRFVIVQTIKWFMMMNLD